MSARRLCVAGFAAACALVTPSVASAGYTDIFWSLDQGITQYGSQFTVGSGASGGDYRWVDTVGRDTYISGNNCSSGAAFNTVLINSGDQSYKRIVNGVTGTCFYVTGRVQTGQGSTATRQGRVNR